MAYAAYSDVVLRYPFAADQYDGRIDAMLEDAAAIIDSEMDQAGVAIDQSDATQMQNLLSVSCSMVARTLENDGSSYGVSSLMQMAGPIQQSVSYANPNGDMYMTAGERRRLGIATAVGAQVYYSSDILGGD